MTRNLHSIEFQEQALSKVRQRGTRSVQDVANELNMAVGTWQCLPFSQAVYDFAQHRPYPKSTSEQQRQAVKFLQCVPPDLPYFDRAYLGLTQLLKTLGARVRTSNPWID